MCGIAGFLGAGERGDLEAMTERLVHRGPDGEGDLSKPGTFQAACEIVGVHAAGWNICVVPADRQGSLDLNDPAETDFLMLTTNGLSNKEPAWFRVRR